MNIYSIFKSKYDTGYIVLECFGGNRGKFYAGMHLNQWGTSDYKTVFASGMVKPIEYATSSAEAAICILADRGDFTEIKIDLASLQKACSDESPGSCALHSKLTKLLEDCRYTDLYLKK